MAIIQQDMMTAPAAREMPLRGTGDGGRRTDAERAQARVAMRAAREDANAEIDAGRTGTINAQRPTLNDQGDKGKDN